MKHHKPTPSWFMLTPQADDLPRKSLAALFRLGRKHGRVVRLLGLGKRKQYLLEHFQLVVNVPRADPPPDPFSLSCRLTHRYNTGWNHLDKWHDIGQARIVDLGKRRDEDHGESYRQLQVIEVKAPGYRPRNVIRALHETLRFGCRCEHDCCGHYFGGASRIRPLGKNRYAVLIRASMNV